jgi:hypothetical protein
MQNRCQVSYANRWLKRSGCITPRPFAYLSSVGTLHRFRHRSHFFKDNTPIAAVHVDPVSFLKPALQ